MALTYISIPTDQYTYASINSLNAYSVDPRPKFIDNSSWQLTKTVEFVGFGYQYTGGTTPPPQTPLYAIFLISSSVSNISSCWLQDGGPSGTDNTHVSTPSSYSNLTHVWHHLNSGSTTPMQLYSGGGTQEISTYEFVYDTEYGGGGGGGEDDNVWIQSGKDMSYGLTYRITVTEHNKWILQTIPVQANYVYDISATVQSEYNYDGIVITTGTHSSPSGSFSSTSGIGGWSDVVLALTSSTSGTSTTSSTTYTATSNGNLYLYFRTDTGTLNPNPETGRVEISGHLNSGITITLNDNGGSGGSGTKTVTSGTVSGNMGSVNVPTRGSNPAFTFVGYYDTVAYSGGRHFIDSSGNGTNGYSITSAITLYARWSNTISYEPGSSFSLTYSTSQQSRTIASTATCASGGTVTYSINSVRKNGTIITNPGFTITLASNGATTNLIVPAGQAVGTYTITIGLTSPNSGNASSNTYAAGSLSKTITVTISESTPQNNAWSNTTSGLIGGTYKRVYTNTQSSPGNIDSVVPGPSTTSEGTSIIELYHDPGTSSNSGVGVGLVGPTVTTSGLGSGVISGRTCFFDGVGVYDFMAQSVNVEPYVGQSTVVRKVYSVHNYDVSASNGVKAVYLGTKSGSTNSVGYYGYSTPAAFNKWASHVSGDSKRKYYAITVNGTYTYDYVEISVQSGKSYIFNMYVDSESNHDGILLTNAIISNPTSAIGYTNLNTYKSNNSSTCLEVCHGNKVSKSYSYTPSSNQTLYLYYYSDVSTIQMGGTTASACIGACEVIERVSMTITFNKVGGSNGTSTTTIYSQTPAADYPSITVPTRSGYTFLGYWDSSAANSGTQYVTSTGAGARVWDKTSNTTLYARWENNISYTTISGLSTYCTNYLAGCYTSTPSSQQIVIANSECSATAGTCTASVYSYPSGNAWFLYNSKSRTLVIPSGVAAGTYNIVIRCTSSSGGTAGSNYYYSQTKDFTVPITINPVTLSSISVATNDDTIKVSYATTIRVVATYSNNRTKDVGSQCTFTFSSSGIAEANKNIAIYIDDYPGDKEEFVENDYETDWSHFVGEYLAGANNPEHTSGANKYYYTGETFTYSGSSYYLWKYVQPDGNNVTATYPTYLLTNTIDYATLDNMSVVNDDENEMCPFVARLNHDKSTYSGVDNDQWLLKVDPGA